ncbi:acyl-CoA thioester hydrolase [Maribacter spongiicola]|uniref:Acyl-CoA thioester hydrolase n=1 Tax=Maribacter spongiicola TaxID=1206753 RepID=A0A4R7JY46_9FLAO|nr:acyl-CoA thioesterase [Maribacter spongiicola]TDT41999.1 acyl-CoA thioester hydrolase [Maribacter spongiicola]
MYTKDFEVRWSDIDANRHLANSAYVNLMSHTRMAFLIDQGFDQKTMVTYKIGPVAFYEHMYYFKEAFLGNQVKVSLEIMGLSEDGKFFEFHHNFYNDKGENIARCEMMGAWISLETRKLTSLAIELRSKFSDIEKSASFKVLTKEDTRKFLKIPKNL